MLPRARFVAPFALLLLACGSDNGDTPAGGSNEGGAGGTSDIGGNGGSNASTMSGGQGGVADGAGGTGGEAPVDMCPRVRVQVTPGNSLNVRPEASTAGDPVGSLPNNAVVDVVSQVQGEAVEGETLWFQISSPSVNGFISAAYSECTTDEPPVLMPPDGFWLPLECGTSATISQGNNGTYTHQGNAYYAFDFAIGLNTPMVAMADGVVLHVYNETDPGDECYTGGGSECFLYANLVVLLHGDGTTTLYKHLNEALVSQDEFVPRGTVIGLSGSTGYSTGRHAHVMRQEDCGQANCQSIPLEFEDVPGGIPDTGDTVTSDNCPDP
ncbi:MAG: M23 family metallopeptidase [Polyangiaceae bacterium]|nr:M23 family metallopeptidase [Polyangiaceae bacterium]